MLFGANHTWLDGGERDPFCGVTNESRFQSMGPINHACHLHCSTLNPRTNCSIIQNEIHTHTQWRIDLVFLHPTRSRLYLVLAAVNAL